MTRCTRNHDLAKPFLLKFYLKFLHPPAWADEPSLSAFRAITPILAFASKAYLKNILSKIPKRTLVRSHFDFKIFLSDLDCANTAASRGPGGPPLSSEITAAGPPRWSHPVITAIPDGHLVIPSFN